MKRIVESRKLLGVNQEASLAELKSIYRGLIKEFHPDKVHDDDTRKLEYESKSKQIISAYHLLVSVAPETHQLNLEEYTRITSAAAIDDFQYTGQTLKINFQDGCVYEYFGVPRNIYIKFVNSPTQARFARRHIYHSYTYRNISKQLQEA
jgi:curved DNA-binding protein CbpA